MNKETSLDELLTAQKWHEDGREVAIATVIETWGSAPRPVGSHLVIDGEGNFEGSVSGGCVEGAVIEEALEVLRTGKAKILEFGVADETAWQVGLSCGGRIRVFVTKLGGEGGQTSLVALQKLNQVRAERKAAIVATHMGRNEDKLFLEGEEFNEEFSDSLQRAFRSGKSQMLEIGGEEYFLNVHLPNARLIVIGAVHITQALAPMARLVGFDLEVIDPRTAFATPERFSGVNLKAEWPEDVLELDRYSALAAVTHDPKIDDYPLQKALETGCFYVGALGSRKTHAKRLERLESQGVSKQLLEKIHSPIGLDIGAASPAEIALAIMGEVVNAYRKRELAK